MAAASLREDGPSMIVEHDLDCGAVYGRRRRDLMATAADLSGGQLAVTVPATPAWTVHDVLAHVVGIAADLNAGRFGTGDPDAWSADQVRERRDRSVAQLAAEWEREGPQFEDGLRVLGYEIGAHYVGDLLQHELDIHDALGLPPVVDGDAVTAALDFYLDDLHVRLVERRIGGVEVSCGTRRLTVGGGQVVAALEASELDLLRALAGRRSEAEVRAFTWTGNVEDVLPALDAYA
jgi:uncharacterized protein (TIGR03083 family)